MISLEERTNKAATLLVEFWWWLHKTVDYMEIEEDTNKELLRIPGGESLVRYWVLHEADNFTMLGTGCCTGQTFYGVIRRFNHLVYSAMRYSFQAFIIWINCFPRLG
jgi:hypothetical protein